MSTTVEVRPTVQRRGSQLWLADRNWKDHYVAQGYICRSYKAP